MPSDILPSYIILYNNQEIKGKFAIWVDFLRQTAQKRGLKIVRSATKGTNRKKSQKTLKKGLTKWDESGIIYKLSRRAVLKASSEVIEN